MHFIFRLALILSPILVLSPARATSPEDRYIAARDAAIAKFAKQEKDGKIDEAVDKAEAAARDELKGQLVAILSQPARPGFAPAQLNLDTLYRGDMGFGMLDGLRFDADTGRNGAKIGEKHADGSFVEPKAHIIVTSEALFTRWLHEHKAWWDKGSKNVPQQIEPALKFEGLYTQAISTDAAVINFNELPVATGVGHPDLRFPGRPHPGHNPRGRRRGVRRGACQRQVLHRLWRDRAHRAGAGLRDDPRRLQQAGG
ncbi:hypothetical protein ACVWY2_003147 [Bradyrhizobium sp. JR6.1]